MSESNEKTKLDLDNITFEPTVDEGIPVIEDTKEQQEEKEAEELKKIDDSDLQKEEKTKKLAVKLGWAEEEPEVVLQNTDAMAGIKTLDGDPMAGIKTLDDDPMAGIKMLDDDPMAGIKTLDDDPMAGIKTLDDDPMAGIKTLDAEPMSGIKTPDSDEEGEKAGDDDFDIFADDVAEAEKEYYNIDAIDPEAEEEISESEYRKLIAAQKKQQKQQEKEDKAKRAAEKVARRAEKKVESAERKRQKKEEARQKKIEKENFGKLRRPKINPSITVLMPTYNPERKIFVEQLRSIDAQTYDNITIFILDDASEVLSKEDLLGVVPRVVTNVEVKIERNETHLGREKTYEKLIQMAETDLVAFATQRDDWDRNKILRLVMAMEDDEDAVLVYSDARVIDEHGQVLSNSLLGYGNFEEFKSGENIARAFLASNSIKLETALIKTEKLKKAVPFAPGMEVDHYIAFRMALEGKITFVGRSLLDSRIHIMQDAELFDKKLRTDKEAYIEKNIESKITGLKWIEKELPLDGELKEAIDEAIIWLMARRENMRTAANYEKELLQNKDFSENELKFELKMAKFSNDVFEQEYKKYIVSLLEPTEAYKAEEKKKANTEKFQKLFENIAGKFAKILTVFQRKPKVRKVNTVVKRQIEKKIKEEEEMLAQLEKEKAQGQGEKGNN